MEFKTFVFYFLAVIMVFAALRVITARNPVHAALFLGGWLSPVGFLPDSAFWLFAKIGALVFFYFWLRATFPRYRYDQIMRLGW